MTTSGSLHEFPLHGKLISPIKDLFARIARVAELRSIGDRELDHIASEFGMSRSELYTLCANKAPTGELLRQRLAESGLSEEMLAKRHPEVLRDLQRVCGNCVSTTRCAHDFADHRTSGRDEYCPNTCTLDALKQEGLAGQG
jgi:hypothetical protein